MHIIMQRLIHAPGVVEEVCTVAACVILILFKNKHTSSHLFSEY